MPESTCSSRTVWIFKQVRWGAIRTVLDNMIWDELQNGTVDDAMNNFMHSIMQVCYDHILRKQIECHKSSHPWLNERCENAIIQKNRAEHTDAFASARDHCTRVLNEEYKLYTARLSEN